MHRILLTDAIIVTGAYSKKGALGIENGRIAGIWLSEGASDPCEKAFAESPDTEAISLDGKILMAGGIDAHVHFREPGLTRKADISTESKAALLGGVTSFIDMPNTVPPTVTAEALEEKLHIASGRSWTNYGFHLGATNSNQDAIRNYLAQGLGSSFGGIKVFMGSSTGDMLVDRENTLKEIFKIREKTVLVHSEDETVIRAGLEEAKTRYGADIPFSAHSEIRSREACVKSTEKALKMAIEYGTRLHVLHVSTAEEVEMIEGARLRNPSITAETSANYLWFCDADYEQLGGLIKCNPSIKTSADRDALRKALAEGLIDTIGSDHAPHLLSEKQNPYLNCPSGIPSIQQSLPVLLSLAQEGKRIPLSRIASAFSEKPAEIFRIKDRGSLKAGNYADLVVADPDESFIVRKEDLASMCGWSPYVGTVLEGKVKMVFLSGELAVKDGKVLGSPAGKPLSFR